MLIPNKIIAHLIDLYFSTDFLFISNFLLILLYILVYAK